MQPYWYESMDAKVWAAAWLETVAKHPDMHLDEGAMLGWFANALERGRSEGLSALHGVKVPKNWFSTYSGSDPY